MPFRFILLSFVILVLVGCDESINPMQKRDMKVNLIKPHMIIAKDNSKSEFERLDNLEIAYGIASTLENNSDKLEIVFDITTEYYRLGDLEKFKKFNDKSLEIAKSTGDSIRIAKTYFYRGLYYRKIDLNTAFKNFYEAKELYTSLDENKNRDQSEYAYDYGKVLIDLAQISRRVNDYIESEALTIRAIEKFEISGKLRYLTLCYTNLGRVSRYLGKYEEAVEYHLKSIEYGKNTKKPNLHAVVGYINIGEVYKHEKKYEKAREYYKKALAYKKYLQNDRGKYASIIDNIAYVNFLSNDLDSIPDSFHKALAIRDSINDAKGLPSSLIHLSEYYMFKNKDSISWSFANRAKNASLEINSNEELLKSYRLLSEVSPSGQGLEYAQKYIDLNDSLIKEERSYRDKFARIRFETAEKEKQITQISRENQILVIGILSISVLFLLGYIIFRQQQSNKELLFEQKQQQSNQEIYRLLLSQQVKLEEGRKMEQQRMSEELHDGVLGRLFGVRLSLDGINQRANDGFTDARNKYIEELKSIEKEIRLISHDLGTETLSPEIAYVDVVESLVSDLCEVHKMDFEFSNDENIDWELVDNQKKVNLFRIIQESLQNIFKHAQAKLVKINFDYVDDKINLTILDDGIGFKTSKIKRGIGLKNITSRVSQMNGVVDFISSNEDVSGTKVSVGVPM